MTTGIPVRQTEVAFFKTEAKRFGVTLKGIDSPFNSEEVILNVYGARAGEFFEWFWNRTA